MLNDNFRAAMLKICDPKTRILKKKGEKGKPKAEFKDDDEMVINDKFTHAQKRLVLIPKATASKTKSTE